MRPTGTILFAAGIALACGLSLLADPPPEPEEGTFRLTILHMNDVYEISPLNRGRVGGLARVATLRKELAAKYPHLVTMHAGDFLSPSAIGTARVNGVPLAGEQMVDVLKAVGIDYIIFGNHEFDYEKPTFEKRLEELRHLRDLPDLGGALAPDLVQQVNDRRRALFSTNVRAADGQPFAGVPRSRIWEPRDKLTDPPVARIGLIALTIKTKPRGEDYAIFIPPIDAARDQLAEWDRAGEKLDAVIAMTHQSLDDDEQLARSGLRIDLIVGGHEHENAHRQPIPAAASARPIPPIYRADANVRTVYLHQLVFDRQRRLIRIESNLLSITDAIPEDPAVAAVVQKWVDLAYRAFRAEGFEPDEELTVITEALDGREANVRSRSTNLTDLIGDAMLAPIKDVPGDARLALYNAGSIRIDDQLLPGPVTGYDVLRVLPFPGTVWAVGLKGDIVQRVLDHKDDRRGGGGFLQTRNVSRGKDGRWRIGDADLDPARTYTVAINDYLLNGNETGFEFLKDSKRVSGDRQLGDWRKLVTEYLRGLRAVRPPAGPRAGAATHEITIKVAPVESPPTSPAKSPVGGDTPAAAPAPQARIDEAPAWRTATITLAGVLFGIVLMTILGAGLRARQRVPAASGGSAPEPPGNSAR